MRKNAPIKNFKLALEDDEIELLEVLDVFAALMEDKDILRESKGISPESIEVSYALAHQMYTSKKYENALKIFKFLTYVDHFDKRFWKGMGACFQMQNQHDKAVEAYAFAALLDGKDPEVPLQAANCFISMGDAEAAESSLQNTIEYAGSDPKNKEIKEKAKSLLQLIRNGRKEKVQNKK